MENEVHRIQRYKKLAKLFRRMADVFDAEQTFVVMDLVRFVGLLSKDQRDHLARLLYLEDRQK